jgi:ADP-ribosyl-[dinitrogen reductase] hydrolase
MKSRSIWLSLKSRQDRLKRKSPPEIKGTGYAAHSLEAALWAFYKSDSFRDGALLAVNLGDDADTTGAVYGQIAGAYYGLKGIPQDWRQKIAKQELIEGLAGRLEMRLETKRERI